MCRRVNTSTATNAAYSQLNLLLCFLAVAWQKPIGILADGSDEIVNQWPKWLQRRNGVLRSLPVSV